MRLKLISSLRTTTNNYPMKNTLLTLFICLLLASCGSESIKAIELTLSEGLQNPIGFHDPKPSFSWKLPVDPTIKAQSSYRIVVASSFDLLPNQADLWDSNAVPSSQSVWINYEGKPLNSKQKVFWQVQYTDDKGRLSLWSEVAFLRWVCWKVAIGKPSGYRYPLRKKKQQLKVVSL